jgi:putative FmdB family regulatory protein
MPIYEYICDHCKHGFEWLVRGSEQPACPSCGRAKLTKQLSVPAAHMSGATTPPCPAKEAGSCAVEGCGGNRCGMSQWNL